jgi:N-acyl amino acid synthase of PEP-CTERM/exosortase system
MEPQLIRMLAAMAIHGEAVGRTIEHHGLRQPYLYNIESFLRGMRCDRPAFWEVLTLKGALYSGD